MSQQTCTVEFESARKHYKERLTILKQSRALYHKNKHRSIPSRGPYEYGLKVAQEEFESAKSSLQMMLRNARKSAKLLSAMNVRKEGATANDAAQKVIQAPDPVRRPKRLFLAKLQQAEALKKELEMH